MATALIGRTGFVGSNIAGQHHFDDLYSSADIDTIRGRHYELVVCAGARAEKWRINQKPEADRADIARLTGALTQADVGRLVLISTVDVYSDPVGVDETTHIDTANLAPYGSHRLELENWARARFETLVVRLPGLFGSGLKKNVLFDLLHENMLEHINPASVYQFYATDWLWHDIEAALAHGIALVNFATQPTSVADVARLAFDRVLPAGEAEPVLYDVHSVHSATLGGSGGYLYDADRVVAALREFVATERARA
jgi:nucleoside-diphosphate-sugar epimerase